MLVISDIDLVLLNGPKLAEAAAPGAPEGRAKREKERGHLDLLAKELETREIAASLEVIAGARVRNLLNVLLPACADGCRLCRFPL
jgi:hypothetical protein